MAGLRQSPVLSMMESTKSEAIHLVGLSSKTSIHYQALNTSDEANIVQDPEDRHVEEEIILEEMVDVFFEEPPKPQEENPSRGATFIAGVKVGTTTMPSDLDGSAASQRQAEQEKPSSTDQRDDEGTFNESNIEQEEVTLEVEKIFIDQIRPELHDPKSSCLQQNFK